MNLRCGDKKHTLVCSSVRVGPIRFASTSAPPPGTHPRQLKIRAVLVNSDQARVSRLSELGRRASQTSSSDPAHPTTPRTGGECDDRTAQRFRRAGATA